jgi:hypothetical protein
MATAMSTLYPLVRAACGDHGVYDDDNTLIANTYIFQDNVIANTMKLALLEISGYSASGTDITPTLTSGGHIEALIVYWTALYLLLPERETFIKTASFSMSKDSIKAQLDFIIGRIGAHLNSGTLAYASDDSWQRLYNAATRRSDQLSSITD